MKDMHTKINALHLSFAFLFKSEKMSQETIIKCYILYIASFTYLNVKLSSIIFCSRFDCSLTLWANHHGTMFLRSRSVST